MKVWVVIGYNGFLESSGCVGVAFTKQLAEQIAEEQSYMLDKYIISEHEIKEV